MTELLFQTDSYLKTFEAFVTAFDQESRAIQLDRTAFYPGGGGQPSDSGVLQFEGRDYLIKKIQKSGPDVLHIIDGDQPLPGIGSLIVGRIDWDRRYALMRTHTALHILCGVVFRDYGALVTGGNMEPFNGRMDFEFETMHKELVEEINEAINREVSEAREVIVAILPREQAFQIPDLIRTKINLLPPAIKEIRVVEIKGLDLQADGGTHVKNTAEVGHIRITDYKSKGKINKRIYIEVE